MSVDHYENFPVASLLLPARLRRPIEAIYRFARAADDIADEGQLSASERREQLGAYYAALDTIAAGAHPAPEFAELAAIAKEWQLPLQLLRDLLDAFSQDIDKARYADHAEVLDYCRRSANPVGRLLLHLAGCSGENELRRSDAICSGLQLANFWQDIAIDWQKDRVYLPQTDLARFGIDEAQIAEARWSPAWAALLDFEIDRAEHLLRYGAPLVHALPGRLGWEIRLTVQGGLRILEKTRRVRGDVFRQRPTLGVSDWLRMSLRAPFTGLGASSLPAGAQP